ncbi:MAG: hypothetical protein AAF221_07325 [Pseudomonadota bacterium]
MTAVTVTAVGARGDGVAQVDGRPIFVPGAVPGDTAWVEGGRIVRIEAGANRAKPRCPHFGPCGGCSLQHLSDAHYAQWLSVPIVRALAQHDLSAEINEPLISLPATRRRAALTGKKSGGSVHLGFSGKRSHEVEDIHDCAVMHPQLEAAVGPLRTFLKSCLPTKAKARASLTLADNGLDIHLDGLPLRRLDVLQDIPVLAAALDGAVRITGQDGPDVDILWQSEAPRMHIFGASVELPVNSFLQATKHGEAALGNTASRWAEGGKSGADLFCGLGTFSFALAKHMKIDGFEASGVAVKAMHRALRPEGMHGVQANHRDLFRRPLTPPELKDYDVVLFDPPRAGAKAQSEQLAQSAVDTVIAISCNPATFARDARTLVDGGYALEEVQPVGQFLWSTHVELAALFKR